MKFEYASNKSEQNKVKHGIDFNEGQELWNDTRHIIIPARIKDEPRFLIIGKMHRKHWSAIFTIRNGKLRIISMRRSQPEEVDIYENR